VRVSTKEQTENLSLTTQLKACEDYCERQAFHVLARFREEGESAKTADRTELQKLLQFCRKNKGAVQFVVVFNLTRFALDKYDHFALRAHLKSLGISLRSATEPIDDTSTGKLMEGVLAAFAQFDNDVRSERTRGGMKAALELGRWTFLAPLGYLNAHRRTGRSLIPDAGRAPLVQRAFQDFATGRFTKHEVRKNVNALGLTTRRGKPVTNPRFVGVKPFPGSAAEHLRDALQRHFGERRLRRLQQAVRRLHRSRHKVLKGKLPTAPDLWLVERRGRHRFIEVKLPGDSMAPHQLAGMAAIAWILNASVEVIELRNEQGLFKEFCQAMTHAA
jgi:DNA invertase Pin-like site-specific DNA recombinase